MLMCVEWVGCLNDRQGITIWIRSKRCYGKDLIEKNSNQNDKGTVQIGMTSCGVVMCVERVGYLRCRQGIMVRRRTKQCYGKDVME